MEQIVHLHIKKLPESLHLATSNEAPGRVVQGCTVTATLEVTRAVAKKLGEAPKPSDRGFLKGDRFIFS